MGCFESKGDKIKAKVNTYQIYKLGQNNKYWRQALCTKDHSNFLVTDINAVPQHPAFRSIDKDVQRTFPNHQHFKDPVNIQEFRLLLKKFACSFPKVGYTQGLNFVGGYFLLNKMNSVESLQCLASLCVHPQLMSLGLYQDTFPLATFYCELFWKLLSKIDPQLFECLKQINLPDYMWIFQWYITFFLYSFPLECIQPFFNFILDDKQFSSVKLSLGIVISLRQNILDLKGRQQFQFVQFLQSLKQFKSLKLIFNINDALKQASKIEKSKLSKCLDEIREQKKIKNFYVNYFTGTKQQKNSYYRLFKEGLQQKRNDLKNSIKNESLRQGFQRSRQSVQILDQILHDSIKRSKTYKSNLENIANSKVFISNLQQKYKTQNQMDSNTDQQKQNIQTNVSIVRRVNIPKD